jgi:hypothetical protein
MKSSLRFLVLATALTLTCLAAATPARSIEWTVNCFVQCGSPPYQYWMPDVTIDACCSYTSGDCFGSGYSVDGGPATVCGS